MSKLRKVIVTGLLIVLPFSACCKLTITNNELKENCDSSNVAIEQLNNDYQELENSYNTKLEELKKLTEKYQKQLKKNKKLTQKNEKLTVENEKLNSTVRLRQLSKAKAAANSVSKETSKTTSKTTTKVTSTAITLTSSELDLLERLVECEAGAEPVSGQIAVVNVVLNRRKSSEFPNSIKGVINQTGQFEPVSTGFINNVKVSSQVKASVRRALNGEKAVSNDTLYFFATYVDSSNPIRNHVTITKTIGGHHFGK